MAYSDQYQQPHRPYNGRAAQRPGPPQGYYGQQAPQQQYAPQQYDQYAPDEHGAGYDDYNTGYAQEYDGGYRDMNGGGRENGYGQGGYPLSQSQQEHEHYGNGPRGAGGPMQRPPTADGMRGGRRGYPSGGPVGRGGEAPPLDRNISSDPGMRNQLLGAPPQRKPLKSPPISPNVASWDSPFPTFPGAKKKTTVSEEQEILQKMEKMELSGSPPTQRGKRSQSKGSQAGYARRNVSTDDYGRPSMDSQGGSQRGRPGPPEDYGRGSLDHQRNMPPKNYPPQGGYADARRGPPGPNAGYAPPGRQNTYQDSGYNDRGGQDGFAAPSRSNTMPNQPAPMGRAPPMPQNPSYTGPGGPGARGLPGARPSTASGNRPPPQRQYPTQGPPLPMDPYARRGPSGQGQDFEPRESVSDFYDAYYEPNRDSRPMSAGSEMPNFDAMPAQPSNGRRGNSIDMHIKAPVAQPTGYGQVKPIQAQPDARGRAQPQAAVFEMVGDPPPMPNAFSQRFYQDDGYGNEQANQYPPQQVYAGYEDPQARGFQPPPRSASAAPGVGRYGGGLPSGPKGGFGGFSQTNPMPRSAPPNDMPSHPPPVRAGLVPTPVPGGTMINNKPPPVRNYGASPAQQQQAQQPQQSPAQQGTPAPAAAKAGAEPPVTIAELEQLRGTVKSNPGDQVSAMRLVKKLIEASDVIVAAIPDQRHRNKTRERYVIDASKLLKKLVAQQNTEAMFLLADSYGRGSLGLETDNKEAFSLYQSAAKLGHAAAAYRTAVCCELGNDDGGGTRKDPLKAIQWYKRAAMLGDTPGMYKVGMILLKGLLGQPKNPREAIGWLKRAAERADAENPHALHELGLIYEGPQANDNSVVRDEAYSFSLFNQAADLGYKFSQFRLGASYEYGLFNCPIDPRQSIMWYSRAAAQEEHQSELALSGWYLTGSEGVLQQSDTEAYLWARKAAMAGLAKAEYAMGYFTEVGIGSPAHLEDAKRWYWRAAAQNFPKARERLEDLKRGGSKAGLKARERISRSKVGKQNEGECSVM